VTPPTTLRAIEPNLLSAAWVQDSTGQRFSRA
jgi:hypothetical protein